MDISMDESSVPQTHINRYVIEDQSVVCNYTNTFIMDEMKKGIVNSTGNVFVDLGYSPEEAAVLQMRGDLMVKLRKYIEAKGMTQEATASLFRISQSRVSDLVRGKWERFSLEMLVTLATRAGMRVTLKTAA